MKTKYPDNLTIQRYLEGKLDPVVAHQLEKQALDDPFLWDALEGYSTYKDPATDLSILQRQLHERIVHMQENKKVFDLSWQRLSVAAAAAVMFVSAGILFWMNNQTLKEQLASQFQNPVEVQVLNKDSVDAVIRSQHESVIASSARNEARVSAPTPARRSDPASRKAIMPSRAEEAFAATQRLATAPYKLPPKSGWDAYGEYIQFHTSQFKAEPVLHGSVTLSFQVSPEGKLSNLKVVNSLSNAHDNEALRIVRKGSDWTPSPDGKVYEQRIVINFGQ